MKLLEAIASMEYNISPIFLALLNPGSSEVFMDQILRNAYQTRHLRQTYYLWYSSTSSASPRETPPGQHFTVEIGPPHRGE